MLGWINRVRHAVVSLRNRITSNVQRAVQAAGSYIRETSAYQRVRPFVEPVFDRVSAWVSNAYHRYQQWCERHPTAAVVNKCTFSVLLFVAPFLVTHPVLAIFVRIVSWITWMW